jgi:hypothetical protein
VVLVAIEPVGMGIRDLCASGQCYPWNYFVLGHYRSVFEPWNDVLRNYARDHPEMARFVSFVDVVCHDDHVPCDDRIDGVPARSDGTHYSGDGETLASTTLADRIAPLLDHTGT